MTDTLHWCSTSKSSLVVLKKTCVQKLCYGLMLVTFMCPPLDTVRLDDCRTPSLTFFRMVCGYKWTRKLFRTMSCTCGTSLADDMDLSVGKWAACLAVALPLQRNSHPHRTCVSQCAPLTGTSTYAQKSWRGHTRCDLSPLTTSFGIVGQWERQHLAMAGSRHHHYPLYATAHRAARANYLVPLWRSGLAGPASCWSTRIPEGFRRMSTCASACPACRRARLVVVSLDSEPNWTSCRYCPLRSSSFVPFSVTVHSRATTVLVRAACKIPTISSWYFFTGSSPSFLSGSRR